MKEKEFNLSEKRIQMYNHFEYSEEDIKEAVKLLKEADIDFKRCCKCGKNCFNEVIDEIDKIFGDKLIEEKRK